MGIATPKSSWRGSNSLIMCEYSFQRPVGTRCAGRCWGSMWIDTRGKGTIGHLLRWRNARILGGHGSNITRAWR